GGVAAGAMDEHARRHLVLRLERPHLTAVLVQEPLGLCRFRYSPVERFFYKFDGIDCCPKLNAKFVNRLIHRWWQAPPPISSATHCFFDGCYHLIDGDVAVGLCHSLAPLFRSATAETTSLAGSAASFGRHSKTRCPTSAMVTSVGLVPFRNGWRTAAVKSAADRLDYLSGITISRSLVSTTKTASSFAGAMVLAFWLTW